MKPTPQTILTITKPSDQPQLSKAQLKFNQLMKKIAGQKQRLLDWQEAIPFFQERLSKEYMPLLQDFHAVKKEVVQLLDRAYADKAIKGALKKKVCDIICVLAEDVVAETDDEEIKEIYNHYSNGDYDAEVAEEQEIAKAMASDMLGIDLSKIGVDFDESPEEMLQKILGAVKEQMEGAQTSEQPNSERKPERKKSKKQLLNEAKQEAVAKEVSQSIREVYRKLAASLHPDREQDEKERIRKTELMQRVNVAYENKDLLTLLNLQLEIEQIDQQHINALSETRLKHYIKILTDQSSELQQELWDIEGRSMAMLGMRANGAVTPKKIMESLRERVLDLQHHVMSIKRDIARLQDPARIKEWVNLNYDAFMQEYDEDEYYFER